MECPQEKPKLRKTVSCTLLSDVSATIWNHHHLPLAVPFPEHIQFLHGRFFPPGWCQLPRHTHQMSSPMRNRYSQGRERLHPIRTAQEPPKERPTQNQIRGCARGNSVSLCISPPSRFHLRV